MPKRTPSSSRPCGEARSSGSRGCARSSRRRVRARHRHAHGRHHQRPDLARRPRVRGHARLGHHRHRRVARTARPEQQPQRSGEDQLFDFDDRSQPFDVIEGGRSGPAAQDASPRRQAATPAREQAHQAGDLHAAHGAALGAPPQPGLLSLPPTAPATTARSGRASRRSGSCRHCRPSPSRRTTTGRSSLASRRCTLPAIARRHDSTVSTVRERSSGSSVRPAPSASGQRGPVRQASPLHPDQQPLQRLEVPVLGRHLADHAPGLLAR